MRSSLWDVIDLVGTDGPDLVVAVRDLSLARVSDLAERVLNGAGLPQLSTDPDQVRPLINARMGTFHARGVDVEYSVAPTLGGLNLLTATDPRYSASAAFARGAGRVLLYCHALVIEDPVALAADMYLSAPAGSRAMARMFLDAAVQSSLSIDELVRAGVIVLYWVRQDRERETSSILAELRPAGSSDRSMTEQAWDAFEALFVDGLHPSLQALWRQIRSGNRSPGTEGLSEAVAAGEGPLAQQFVDVVSSLRPSAVVENVLEALATSLHDVAAMGGKPDVYAPSSLFARLLFASTDNPADDDAARLRELVRLDVPRLDDLTWRDVVAIRQQDGGFAEWRSYLGHGLDRLRSAHDAEQVVDARRVMLEALAGARAQLDRSTRKSRVTARATDGLLAFVLGGLGGAAGAAGQPATVTALAGAGAGTGAAAVAAATGHHGPPAASARHYVLFDHPANAFS